MTTYQKIKNNVSNLVLKNKSEYETTKDIFEKRPTGAVAKFNDLLVNIQNDIRHNRISKNANFSEHEELNLFTMVLYYRLIRNLISIECLLEYANPESEHFDCIEYSVAILLRANLLDCKLLYKSRKTSDINRHHLDAFQNFLRKFKLKHKTLNQDTNRSPEALAPVEREIEFCQRIINCLSRNAATDTPAPDPAKFNDEMMFFMDIESQCNDLYDIYSKYDHFSLYEISKLHWNRSTRLEAMHQAILLQIPALHICYAVLGGIELTPKNISTTGEWMEDGIEV